MSPPYLYLFKLLAILLCISLSEGAKSDVSPPPLLDEINAQQSTVRVCPSTAPKLAVCNYRTTGKNDQNVINRVIANLPPHGGKVIITNGEYSISAPIIIDRSYVDIEGESTPHWGGYNASWTSTAAPVGQIGNGASKIQAEASGFNLIEIRNLNVPDGNGTTKYGSDQNRHRGIRIAGLYLVGHNYTDTGIATPYANTVLVGHDVCFIEGNFIQRTHNGISVTLDSPHIRWNSIQDISGTGISVLGLYAKVYGNLIFDIGGLGINSSSNGGITSGNNIGDTAGDGIYIGAKSEVISANTLTSILGKAINNGSGPGHNTINANAISSQVGSLGDSAFDAIFIATDGNAITGNTIVTSSTGKATFAININSTTGNTVVGNAISGAFNFGGNPIAGSRTTNQIGYNTEPLPLPPGPALVKSGTMAAWYQASSITSAGNDDLVTSWPDDSGFNNPLRVFGGAPKAVATSNINGAKAVRFNGNGDVLGNNELGLLGQPITMFIVVSFSASASAQGHRIALLNSNNPDTTSALVVDNASNRLAAYAGNYVTSDSSHISINEPYVLEILINGPHSLAGVNGRMTKVFDPGKNNWTRALTVGANASRNGEWMAGDISEIVIYAGALNSSDRGAVRQALGAKYMITVSP